MKERFKQFFSGRYGGDPLNTVLSVIALVFFVLGALMAFVPGVGGVVVGTVLYLIAAAAVAFSFYRMFSRDLTARKKEYDWYRAKVTDPIRRFRSQQETKRKQRKTHKFFKCPKCRQTVRVPRGKGKLKITCPKCGEVFIKET